ncbi:MULTISPECIES: Hpt domain-containing protein [Roseobacteraceae]|uniref:Hpt domain protein n=1 Tax=Pseudosulfitobacter pseudonitzschiae TaxID=1402135 RepID=A0A221K737_9RHOB|nr:MULTISPECIES: Hpt domain-containing protein [Roseobacteraceae]ASM74796.1 Hpt domain protein [Pseudosulfitobacter pseudonitzschiae]
MMMQGGLDMVSGLEKIRSRFLDLLEARRQSIAHHAVQAYDGITVEDVNDNLAAARDILHQIAGTAGSLGFEELGASARFCENEIIAHLTGPDNDLALCPDGLLVQLDDFVRQCHDTAD